MNHSVFGADNCKNLYRHDIDQKNCEKHTQEIKKTKNVIILSELTFFIAKYEQKNKSVAYGQSGYVL